MHKNIIVFIFIISISIISVVLLSLDYDMYDLKADRKYYGNNFLGNRY